MLFCPRADAPRRARSPSLTLSRSPMTQIERARGSFTSFILFASMAGAACLGDTHPQVPTTFNKLTDNQQAPVGTAVPLPPTVSILDADGKGIPGIQVTFA